MKTAYRQQGSILSIVLLILIVALGAYIGWQYSQKEATPVIQEKEENKDSITTTAETKPIEEEATTAPTPSSPPPSSTPEPEKQLDAVPPSPSNPTKAQVVTEAITDIIETTTSEVIPTPVAHNTDNKIENNEEKSESEPSSSSTTESNTELNQATQAAITTETEQVAEAVETAITTASPVMIDQKPAATLPIRLRYKDHFQPNRIIVLTVEIENNTSDELEVVAGDVVLSLEDKEIARLSLEEHDILAEKNKARRYQLTAQQSKTWGVEIAETRLPSLYELLSVTPVEQFKVQFFQTEK